MKSNMTNQPAKIKKITVIGGGIVGVAAALKLQLDGHKVRLIDRKEPGRETSMERWRTIRSVGLCVK